MYSWKYSREAREAMAKMGVGPLYEKDPKDGDDDDDDGGEGGGSGEGNKGGFRKQARALIARHTNAEDALVELMREGRDKRQTIRELREKLPPEGSVVLTGDLAAKVTALGGPKKLDEALKERDDLKTFKTGRELQDVHYEAAEAEGWNKKVLHDVAQARGLTVTVATEDVVEKDAAGKETKVPRKVARVKVGSGAPESLKSYFERELPDYLPALQVKKEDKSGDMTPFPRQSGRETGGGGDPIQKRIDEQEKARKAEKSPLSTTP